MLTKLLFHYDKNLEKYAKKKNNNLENIFILLIHFSYNLVLYLQIKSMINL